MSTRQLHAYTGGFLANARHRRILELAGWEVRSGWPGPDGTVGIWGKRPISWRGRFIAAISGADLLTIEDGFLRSAHPSSAGDQTMSICLDDLGIYFETATASRLEALIDGIGEEGATLERARAAMNRLRSSGVSKYTPVERGTGHLPTPGYVLVIDQTCGDASIPGAGASATTFAEMLSAARHEHPDRPILVRSHPDTRGSRKTGHFSRADLNSREVLLDLPLNPWDVLDGADAVYTVSSQMGFEALIAGKPVTCFGRPFYAGWGLTDDRMVSVRTHKARSLEQIFAAAYFNYCIYYDPFTDRLIPFEEVLELLAGQVKLRALEPSGNRLILHGFRAWKRRHSLRFSQVYREAPKFVDDEAAAIDMAAADGAHLWFWASRSSEESIENAAKIGARAWNVEDGFLRSVGLGAELVAPASLVFDDLGIYYDPNRPSWLERLIAEAATFPNDDARIVRAAALRATLGRLQLTKYNTGTKQEIRPPDEARVILVPGQVEDDASIRLGAPGVSTNLGLLHAARRANPDGWIVYKPHPDVEAGLRVGAIDRADVKALADEIAVDASAAYLIDQADEIWTMTSLMGFEGLLRGKSVTCLGLPFYAGWGLTTDHIDCPRRTARPRIDALVWASLIAYPRYVDPVTQMPCEVEVVVDRLGSGSGRDDRWTRRKLARLQGWFAGMGLIFWR
ncbi:MAG: capsular polysaccharide biosynthesis protein [Pseudomonadota bacterium]